MMSNAQGPHHRAISEESLVPFSTWVHFKGGTYTVLGVATCSDNGLDEGKRQSVVYFSHKYQELRYREVSQFLDGRFVPVQQGVDP
jgi:hypothetical protein